MIGVLLAVTVAASPAPSNERCTLARLSVCRNTNELIWDKAFRKAVRRFLSTRRASFLYPRGLVADQMIEVLGGPPDLPEKIGPFFRFTACRAHSCEEKGAAVLEPGGGLIALGILYSACGIPHPADDCPAHDTLAIFVRDPVAHQGVIANLSDWARSEVAQSYTYPGMPKERLDAVRVEGVS